VLANVYEAKILQIIDSERMLITISSGILKDFGPVTLLLPWPTEGLADDTKLNVEGKLFVVTGTYQYTTTTGAGRTIMTVEGFDPRLVQAEMRKAKQKVQAN
jgi:hypothetical protein